MLGAKAAKREALKARSDAEIEAAAAARGDKKCSTCKEVKDALTEFTRDRGRPDGRGPDCRACSAGKSAADRAARPDVYKVRRSATYGNNRENGRKQQLKFKFGITPEQYWEMHAAQGGVCAICGQPETRVRNGRVCDLVVDHDHTTGAIRQLLCSKCNTGIGWFRDDPELLRVAALYVQNHKSIQQRESPPA